MQKRIITLSRRHFQDKFIIYLIISIFFIGGIVAGSIMINRFAIEQNNNIIKHFSWIFDYINNGDQRTSDILKFNLFFTMKFSILIWILGFTILGIFIIPAIITLKGITMGLTVGLLIKEFQIKGLIFSLLGLLPNYLITLPGIIAIGSIGLSNSIDRSMGRGRRPYGIYQNKLDDYTILFVLFFLIVILGYGIESIIAPCVLRLINLS